MIHDLEKYAEMWASVGEEEVMKMNAELAARRDFTVEDIENLSEDDFASAFVKMVSELARTIGVAVCVEGVEQRKQLEVLQKMNVSMIQGFYYGKPMPVEEFERLYL